MRGAENQLFVTTKKPYQTTSRDTLSRWVKLVLKAAGIDTELFRLGSTQAAASSKAKKEGVPLDELLKVGGGQGQPSLVPVIIKK